MPKKPYKAAKPKSTTSSGPVTITSGQALVIVEAPGKVQKIQGYLGPQYKVMASVGHIMDLPKKGLGVDIDNNYAPTYVVIDNKTEVVADLKAAAAQVSTIFLCSDSDREGEFISYSVAMQLNRPGVQFHRVTYNAITKQAILTAFKSPRTLDKNLVRAQQGRRILDRLVGFKASPLLWGSIQMGLSAGRVQSVALRLIVDRQEEIDAFKPRDYWTIKATLKTAAGEEFVAEIATEHPTEADAQAVVAALQAGNFVIKNVDSKTRFRAPLPPFTTSQMIQQASTILNWGAKRTNSAAQQLYELAYVTYIRSDSTFIDPAAIVDIRTHLQNVGLKYLPKAPLTYSNSANAQEAHEAIRPTDLAFTPAMTAGQMPPDCQALYELIYRRAIASQSTPAEFLQVLATIENSGIELSSKGQTLIFDGFLQFWTYSNTKESELPPLKAGDVVTASAVDPVKHTTKPPARYNTASIVKELEENGVGRPSTYQSIIDTLTNRKYVTEDGKALAPTPIGKEVVKILKQYTPRVVDVQFTADMELKLDDVASGKLDWIAAIDACWKPLSIEIETASTTIVQNETTTPYLCLKCQKPLIRKVSRGGPFYCCTDRTGCKSTYQIAEDGQPQVRVVEVHGQKCQVCGSDMIKRHVKATGVTFWGCSGYEINKCLVTLSNDGVWKIPAPIKVIAKCDKCKKGDMILKTSHKGQQFAACNQYPRCRNAKSVDTNGNIVEKK